MTRQHTAYRSKTQAIALAGLCIALTAVCSWISVPVPGTSVPINLATFAVILSGMILGKRYGALSMAAFLLLGALGVPVFHGFTGGLGIVAGPTGGFLFGYIALAFVMGWYADSARTKDPARSQDRSGDPPTASGLKYTAAVVLGEAFLYALGTVWFLHMAGGGYSAASLSSALLACVVPFLPGDAAKAVLAYLVFRRLERALEQGRS